MKMAIPNPVVAVVADVLGNYYFNHSRLNVLFMESGAPGDIPHGMNCVDKCAVWLKRCNTVEDCDALAVLGAVLENFMEVELTSDELPEHREQRERITRTLEKYGFRYLMGGKVMSSGMTVPAKSFAEVVRDRDTPSVLMEFDRALAFAESDPAASVTAACSLVEAFCKTYLEDRGIDLPSQETIKPLWKAVASDLFPQPSHVADQDVLRILSGLMSCVDGLGAFRTHAGSAHGRGLLRYKVEPRHARLAVNAASTLVILALETWDKHSGHEVRKLAELASF